MYTDKIKLFAKNEKKLETLIEVVRIYNQDIGIEWGIEKCGMLIIKSRKRQRTKGIELPNQGKIRTLGEKKTYNYLKILEVDTIKHAEMKEKFFKINTLGEQENYSKYNYIAKISTGKLIHGLERKTLGEKLNLF